MALVAWGLLIGMVALLWILVLAILQGDRQSRKESPLKRVLLETRPRRHEKAVV
jgi:hypothetical protein